VGAIRDWVREKLRDLRKWFEEHIIEPLVEWIHEALEEIMYRFRLWRHKLNELIEKWISTDLGFLLALDAVLIAILLGPQLIDQFKSTAVYSMIKDVAQKIIDGVIDLFDPLKLINWKLLHDILQLFWDDYAEVSGAFNNAVSQIAAELGEGSAYIHAYLASARGIYYGTAVFTGSTPNQAEMEWYADSTEFIKEANKNFERYARDPANIYYDFMTHVLIPRADTQNELRREELARIEENYRRQQEMSAALDLVRDSVETFIENMPAEIEEEFRKRWDPVRKRLDRTVDYWEGTILPYIDGLYLAVNEWYDMQEKVNAAALDKALTASRTMQGFWEMQVEERGAFAGFIEAALTLSIGDEAAALSTEASEVAGRIQAASDEIFGSFTAQPALAIERGEIRFPPERRVNVPSPFVGEY